VARRLQLGARAVAYGEKNLVFQGPYPTGAVLEVTRGLLNVTYSQELVWRRRDARAFEVRRGGKLPPHTHGAGKPTTTAVCPLAQVCCSGQQLPCRWAPAPVVAVGSRTVTLAPAGCGTPALALRYAWAEWPCPYLSCVLYNRGGLPAPPFLLDALPGGQTAGGTELLLVPRGV